jgi:hypothetical protein
MQNGSGFLAPGGREAADCAGSELTASSSGGGGTVPPFDLDGYLASATFPLAGRVTWRDHRVGSVRAAFLGTVNAETGVGILLVEQNAALALDLADHVFLLETGRVVMDGPSEALRRDESIRKSYLGY